MGPNKTTACPGGMGSDRPVYLVDGARTPFIKVRKKPNPFSPVDLAIQCGRPLLLRHDLPPDAIDQVILGCVNVLADEMNPARLASLRLGLPETTGAYTVQINCGSGMQSIDNGFRMIREGSRELVLAGGTEALSHAPLQFKQNAVDWLAEMRNANSLKERAQHLTAVRPEFLKPVIALQQGLTDPIVGLSMGETAEVLAHLFDIRREDADQYAVISHQRLARAQKEGYLEAEIEPAISCEGELFDHDDGVRTDCTVDDLSKLPPVFEPPYGQVTAGNSSQITDGASWIMLASEAALKRYNLTPRARLIDSQWAALDPEIMGLAPALSVSALLQRQNLSPKQVDLWEINEAFAVQVLACLKAWEEDEFCRRTLGLEQAFGEIDRARLNVDGGAVSLGHPVGASGNRIVLHLVNAMSRLNLKHGIATECIGGGQSGAMLLEGL